VNNVIRRNRFRPVLEMLCICAVASTVPYRLWAQAATTCPAYSAPGPNLALSPDFETEGPCGASTHWAMGTGNCGVNSAAQNWTIHSSNSGAAINTYWVTSTLPIGGLQKMLHIVSKGNESGVWQTLPTGLTTVMVSAWVYVKTGHVVLQATAGTTGPSAWNDKYNEWEELRVCTNGTVPVDTILIWNEDPTGAEFLVDRVEARVISE
jgi:hypothetical protein